MYAYHATVCRRVIVYHASGVLLTGPPGVGKSHVLRHIAASSGLPVHTLRSVDLIDGVTGASLRRLTAFWSVALASPCIVLLDDVQELAPAQPRIAFQVCKCWVGV